MAQFEGLKNLASAVATVAVPIVVAVLGSYYTLAIKEREVSGKFVELAIQILSKEPSKSEADAGIRRGQQRFLINTRPFILIPRLAMISSSAFLFRG